MSSDGNANRVNIDRFPDPLRPCLDGGGALSGFCWRRAVAFRPDTLGGRTSFLTPVAVAAPRSSGGGRRCFGATHLAVGLPGSSGCVDADLKWVSHRALIPASAGTAAASKRHRVRGHGFPHRIPEHALTSLTPVRCVVSLTPAERFLREFGITTCSKTLWCVR
jgi:hypothetical protein